MRVPAKLTARFSLHVLGQRRPGKQIAGVQGIERVWRAGSKLVSYILPIGNIQPGFAAHLARQKAGRFWLGCVCWKRERGQRLFFQAQQPYQAAISAGVLTAAALICLVAGPAKEQRQQIIISRPPVPATIQPKLAKKCQRVTTVFTARPPALSGPPGHSAKAGRRRIKRCDAWLEPQGETGAGNLLEPLGDDLLQGRQVDAQDALSFAIGSSNTKVLPWPSSDSAQIPP
jgi:hypothetical protein